MGHLSKDEIERIREEERIRARERKRAEDEIAREEKPPAIRPGCAIALLLVGIPLLVIRVMSELEEGPDLAAERRDSERSKQRLEENRLREAWNATIALIEPSLTSPATAQWPATGFFPEHSATQLVTRLDGNRFKVRAWVDSQNSFGALIRTHFACEVEHNPKTDRWQLNSFREIE